MRQSHVWLARFSASASPKIPTLIDHVFLLLEKPRVECNVPKSSNNGVRRSLTSKTKRWHFCSSLTTRQSQDGLNFPLSSLPTQPQPKRKPTFIKIHSFRTAMRCRGGKQSLLLVFPVTVTFPPGLEAASCNPPPGVSSSWFPELRKESFQKQLPWSGPSGPAATGELNSTSSLFFVFPNVSAVLERCVENRQLLLAFRGFQKLHFPRAGQMWAKTSLHLTHQQTKLFNLWIIAQLHSSLFCCFMLQANCSLQFSLLVPSMYSSCSSAARGNSFQVPGRTVGAFSGAAGLIVLDYFISLALIQDVPCHHFSVFSHNPFSKHHQQLTDSLISPNTCTHTQARMHTHSTESHQCLFCL